MSQYEAEVYDFTALDQCLLILAGLRSQLASALNSLSPWRPENEDLSFTVCNHIQIILCSFLDEWKVFESFGEAKVIRDTLKITSPAMRRIRSWTGLERIRSTLLAHGQRHKDGSPVWTWDVFNSNKTPTTYLETILLGRLAVLVIKETLRRHHGEYHRAGQRLSQSYTCIKRQGISTVGEADVDFRSIKAEMQQISNQLTNKRHRIDT